MKTYSWQQLDRFWAQDLGIDSSLPSTAGVCCSVQHLYSGVQLFAKDDRLVIAAPPTTAERINNAIVDVSPEEAFSVEWLQHLFGNDAERILGPAEISYADETTFRSEGSGRGRTLLDSESEAYRLLVGALDADEIESSGVSSDGFPAFGVFFEDLLCSVASYEVWKPSIAHIRVATHPKYRRQGFAKAAVQALAAEALASGLILQWRALASNKNSLSLSRNLGFNYYCSTLFVRLRKPE